MNVAAWLKEKLVGPSAPDEEAVAGEFEHAREKMTDVEERLAALKRRVEVMER